MMICPLLIFLLEFSLINTIFVIMKQIVHFETTASTIADKNSRIVVEAK